MAATGVKIADTEKAMPESELDTYALNEAAKKILISKTSNDTFADYVVSRGTRSFLFYGVVLLLVIILLIISLMTLRMIQKYKPTLDELIPFVQDIIDAEKCNVEPVHETSKIVHDIVCVNTEKTPLTDVGVTYNQISRVAHRADEFLDDMDARQERRASLLERFRKRDESSP